MKKGNIDNTTLDAVGKMLVRSEARRTPDIDLIVGDPYLFARVKARINAGTPDASGPVWSSALRHRLLDMCGSAAILVLAVGAITLLRMGRGDVSEVTIYTVPDVQPEAARPVIPPQGISFTELSTGRAAKSDFRVERAAARRSVARRAAPPRVKIDADGEFYPVAYTGDPFETAGGGRIIRVDLKRSSLFALGVDLPLENEKETVKADLLVGSDGVTRAVRVVKDN